MTPPEGSALYEEKQHFGWSIMAMAVVGVLVVTVVAAVLTIKRAGQGSGPMPTGVILMSLAPFGLVIAATLLPLLLRVETQVRTRGLYVRLMPFPWRHVPASEITTHEATSFRPLRDCGGYGMHKNFLTKTTSYNARGNRGVRIELTDGKRLIIGSQTPDRLARAISQLRGSDAATGQ
ncbi:hypothetical protein CVU37_04540 [candidate division BRC1 bacterium HGW-BRC1-1]|jgi:hypothetical protein|nr:MAG: hypothetical protein CVU37_04540 [candidate division BRC1 bacterium HGW-BRC1-1]